MSERSKALRSGRSPVLWAWVQIPLLTKFIFYNYNNYCLQYHAGPTHLSRILRLLKSLILVNIVFCNYDNYSLQCEAGPTHLSRILNLLKSWILVNIVVSQDGRSDQGAALRAQFICLGVGSNPTSDKVHLLQL